MITINNSKHDYYIKLDLNAGYEWNDLEITNLDINDYNSNSADMEILAYVDGIQVDRFPATCGYSANVELYNGNTKIDNNNSSAVCTYNDSKWSINLGKVDPGVDKIKIFLIKLIQ